MTPAAITPAGRKKTVRSPAAAGTRTAPGHRRTVPERAAPAKPRRLSGPLKGRAAPRPEPSAPRRGRAQRRPRNHAPNAPLGARVGAFIRSLPDHPLLDRAIRGRAWIPILGVMLAGIVAMQVEVLKLGASIGRSIQHGSTLQTQNEQLRASVATLDDDQRIEALAAKAGMVMPSPAGVGFLSARSGGEMQRVIGGIHAPNSTSFLALMSANGAVTSATSADPTSAYASQSSPNASSSSSAGSATSTSSSAASTAGSATGATGSSSTATSGTATTPSSTGTTATPVTTPAASTPATGTSGIATGVVASTSGGAAVQTGG
jgi:hypothetical protein